jgi:tRNA nucleotidyltransferase/poly(A) polymerase
MSKITPDLTPFAGEWVALAGGRVAGVGASATEAEAAARIAWPDAALDVCEAPPVALTGTLDMPPLLDDLQPLLAGLPVWLVGGAVRDRLLGRPLHDLDFAVDGDGIALGRRVADRLGGAFYALDSARGTGRVVFARPGEDPLIVDFARLRGAITGGTAETRLLADLADRDFTINAMALPADATNSAEAIDPLGGRADLLARRIRATGPDAIRSDPNRALRALRQSAELRFAIDADTHALIERDSAGLRGVAAERVLPEFIRLLCAPGAPAALRTLDRLGLLELLVPEVATMRGVAQGAPHYEDVLNHTFTALDRLEYVLGVLGLAPLRVDPLGQQAPLARVAETLRPYAGELRAHLAAGTGDVRTRRALLPLAVLLHDCGKPQTRDFDTTRQRINFPRHDEVGARLALARARALRLTAAEATWLATIVREHMLAGWREGFDDVGVYRYFRKAGAAGVDALLVTTADQLAAHARYAGVLEHLDLKLRAVDAMLAGYFRRHSAVVNPPALINGRDVLDRGVPPGPRVAELLEAVHEAQVAGRIHTRDEALALVMSFEF